MNINSGIAYYQELKNKDIAAFNFDNPKELNSLGYEFLNQNKIEDAIEIFELLVAEFPNSANAFDSLGEAYYKSENYKLALKNYKKSFELYPKNSNAKKMISKITLEKN